MAKLNAVKKKLLEDVEKYEDAKAELGMRERALEDARRRETGARNQVTNTRAAVAGYVMKDRPTANVALPGGRVMHINWVSESVEPAIDITELIAPPGPIVIDETVSEEDYEKQSKQLGTVDNSKSGSGRVEPMAQASDESPATAIACDVDETGGKDDGN